MQIDFDDLQNKLLNLTGKDFMEAERDARNAGDIMPMITFSTGFQIRLAAKALKTNPRELENLPLNQYSKVATTVSNALFSSSDEESAETGEQSQKTPSEK